MNITFWALSLKDKRKDSEWVHFLGCGDINCDKGRERFSKLAATHPVMVVILWCWGLLGMENSLSFEYWHFEYFLRGIPKSAFSFPPFSFSLPSILLSFFFFFLLSLSLSVAHFHSPYLPSFLSTEKTGIWPVKYEDYISKKWITLRWSFLIFDIQNNLAKLHFLMH